MKKKKAWLSWSSGKDSAFALHETRRAGELEIVGLLTTINTTHERVAMHAVRRRLLHMQAEAAGLPLVEVELPWPCPNEVYEALMTRALEQARGQDVTHMVFGDLFLEDIRAYRLEKLAPTGIEPVFPLWLRNTAALAREMIDAGLVAHLTTVDPKQLPPNFVGRRFDHDLLRDLPPSVDPCGENGEFHTFVSEGPMFERSIPILVGERVARDGFHFCDILPAESDTTP